MKQIINYINEVKFGVNNKNHGYVPIDMDFPSGTKWCNKNLGAKTVEDAGDYYKWGETTKTTRAASNDDYKFYKDPDKFTKYGEAFKCEELDENDDVAHTILKGKWYMPTEKQIKELIDNTTFRIITKNNKSILEFTSKFNKAKLLFPLAGIITRNQDDPKGVNERTRFWSCERGEWCDEDEAISFLISLSTNITNHRPRISETSKIFAYNIRAVCNN